MNLSPRRPFSRLNRQPIDNGWYVFVLAGLLLMFWMYAWYIERIDTALVTAWLNQRVPLLPTSPGLSFFLGFFHWKVMRHILPIGVGWYFAYDAAVVLVKLLYDLPDRAGAKEFLSRLLGLAAAPVNPPEIFPTTLAAQRQESVLLRVGGPGRVRVPTGHVMVTELNGRFHRILSAGSHTLGRYEYIHAVLNLQPQERRVDKITAYSQDGIELCAELKIVFRVQVGTHLATRENPYPYDETAVRTAAYAQTVFKDGGAVGTWEDAPPNMAKSTLIGILAGYKLDEIIYPERPGEEPFRTLNNQLHQKTRAKLDNIGVDLLEVSISQLDLPSGVNEQYINYWKSHWESQMMLNRIDGEATAVEELEIARAEAEITMVQAILEGVQRARREGATTNMDEVVAMRLVEAMEAMARQSQQLLPLPNALLPQLKKFRNQLNDGDEEPEKPKKSEP